MHHHAERVADQDDVAIGVDDARGVGVIRGQAHERLAALAGADVGRGEPPNLVLHGHRYVTSAGVAEHRHADDDRMKDEAERQIDDRADDDGDHIVFAAADRYRRRTGIAAVFQRDAVIHRPSQHRAEQDHAAEIAIGAQMRNGPGFRSDQHRMLKDAFDIAGDIGRGDHDAGGPHQRHHDVAGPSRRIPNDDEPCRAIACKTVRDEDDAEDGDQREQAAIGPLAEFWRPVRRAGHASLQKRARREISRAREFQPQVP